MKVKQYRVRGSGVTIEMRTLKTRSLHRLRKLPKLASCSIASSIEQRITSLQEKITEKDGFINPRFAKNLETVRTISQKVFCLKKQDNSIEQVLKRPPQFMAKMKRLGEEVKDCDLFDLSEPDEILLNYEMVNIYFSQLRVIGKNPDSRYDSSGVIHNNHMILIGGQSRERVSEIATLNLTTRK